jgi:enamine deaminase RidA (YjgF/YER057c/UK114 family)
MDIVRIQGTNPFRSRVVRHSGLVWTVAAGPVTAGGMYQQTKMVLQQIDKNLAEGFSDKSLLLTSTVYITDFTEKAEMDRAWEEWIISGTGPQRACVEVSGLGLGVKVEIAVMGASKNV